MLRYRRRLLYLCGLLFCLWGTTGQAAQLDRAVQYHGIARGNYLIGDHQGALRAIEVCLKSAPEYLPALRLKTRIFLDQEDFDRAGKTLAKALEHHPGDPGLLELMSLVDRAQSERKAGAQSTDQTTSMGKNRGEGLKQRFRLRLDEAKQLARTGRIDEATRALERLLGERPENLEVSLTLASIYADSEQWTRVDGLIPKLRADPRLRDIALYLEGRVAFSQDRIGTARARFEEAIDRHDPGGDRLRPSLHFYHGLCLDRLKREKAADAAVARAIDGGFEAETVLEAKELGRLLLRAGRAEAAISRLERFLLSDAKASPTLWSQLGRAHQMEDQVSLAISALNQSLRLEPGQAKVRALRGSLLRRIGDLEGARADYREAVELMPENAALHYALGLTDLQTGRLSTAEQALAQSSQSADKVTGQQLLHALTAHAIGDHKTARGALLEYLENQPVDPAASAVYLAHLLRVSVESPLDNPVLRYFRDEADRKEVLDWAGYAETPADARRRICAAAYWLAQKLRSSGEATQAEELLEIAVQQGTPDHPEYQFSRWQLKQVPGKEDPPTK